jgi:hypothetical protein
MGRRGSPSPGRESPGRCGRSSPRAVESRSHLCRRHDARLPRRALPERRCGRDVDTGFGARCRSMFISNVAIDPSNSARIAVSTRGNIYWGGNGVLPQRRWGDDVVSARRGIARSCGRIRELRSPASGRPVCIDVNRSLSRADLSTGLPAGNPTAVEYYHARFDHYFVTADADEIVALNAGAFEGWVATPRSVPGRAGVVTGAGAGVPVLRRRIRAAVVALLHALPGRVRDGQAGPEVVVREAGVRTSPARRQFGVRAGYGSALPRVETAIETARPTTATRPTIRNSTRCSNWDGCTEGEASTKVFACVRFDR